MEDNFTTDWVKWHEGDWLRWLGQLKGQNHVAALEVGSYEGRSSCWFCDNILTGSGSYCVCIDPWTVYEIEERFDVNRATRPIFKRPGRSRNILAQLITENRRYSFAYVDGDHSAAETLADLCMVWPLIAHGGVLIVDDYGWTSPDRPIPPQPAIDAFLTCYADRIVKHEISKRQVAIWK